MFHSDGGTVKPKGAVLQVRDIINQEERTHLSTSGGKTRVSTLSDSPPFS